jgi:uncharacterized repeat protein (TIGR02543 family)
VNGCTFRGDFTTQRYGADNVASIPKEILIEDIDIIYARGVFGFGGIGYAIFQGGGSEGKMLKDGVRNTGQMVHFRNINVEDPRPLRTLFGMEDGPTLAGMRFENVNYTKQCFGWKSGIKGNPTSEFRNFVFENVSMDGQKFGTNNTINPKDFVTNQYLYDMTYRLNYKIPSTNYTLVTSATGGIIQVNTETGTPGQVSVTAVPHTSYKFSHWSGNITGTDNTATFTMDSDKGITANFTLVTYTITKTATNGTITLEPAYEAYRLGAEVTVKAVPDFGFKFNSWGGDLSGSVKEAKITIDGDKNISASFDAIPTYELVTNATNGFIDVKPKASVFEASTVVKIMAIPELGYKFSGWNGDLSGTTNPATIVMTENKNITANFTKVEGSVVFATNCGGPAFTASDGVNYTADTNFLGGNTSSTNSAISGTTDDVLYQSERWGASFSYNIPLPNGTYQVMLEFAEIYFSEANKRVFNVTMEKSTVITGLDICLQTGANSAYYAIQTVIVTDGEMNISFTGTTENAKVSAIKIFKESPTGINDDFNNLTEQTMLLQNYPNPFSIKTSIPYHLGEASDVELSIYDIFGRKVAVLVNEHQAAGSYSVDWVVNDDHFSNGFFLYHLKTNNKSVQIKKASLIK